MAAIALQSSARDLFPGLLFVHEDPLDAAMCQVSANGQL